MYGSTNPLPPTYHMTVWVVCTDTKCVTTLIVPAITVLISVPGSMCPAVSYLSCIGVSVNYQNIKVSLRIYLQNYSPLTGRIRKLNISSVPPLARKVTSLRSVHNEESILWRPTQSLARVNDHVCGKTADTRFRTGLHLGSRRSVFNRCPCIPTTESVNGTNS